jgi:hypothetical protein
VEQDLHSSIRLKYMLLNKTCTGTYLPFTLGEFCQGKIQFASGMSCDRPTRSKISVVFLGPRINADLVRSQIPRCTTCFICTPPPNSNIEILPHYRLPNVKSKFHSNSALPTLISKLIPIIRRKSQVQLLFSAHNKAHILKL